MATYDNKLEAVALHFLTTSKNAHACSITFAKKKDMRWGDALDSIFLVIPENLRNFYVLIQDATINEKKVLALMEKADYKTGLYYLRVFARYQTHHMMAKLFDIFVANHDDERRAWQAIELGIAEKHIGEVNPLEITEKSRVFMSMQGVVDMFHRQGKDWVARYLTTASGRVKFLSTILITHFGYLIRRFKDVDVYKYSRSSLFRKPRGLETDESAMYAAMILYAAAIGAYADDPEKLAPKVNVQYLGGPVDDMSPEEYIEEYENYNIYL